MPGRRSLLIALLLAVAPEAPAQFVPGPIPFGGPVIAPALPVLVPNGIGFDYRGRRLRVSGFFGTGGYGVLPVAGYYPGVVAVPSYLPTVGYIDSRSSVHVITPPVVIAPRPPIDLAPDLSGVDLDRSPSPLHELEGKPRIAVPRDPPPVVIKPEKEVKPKAIPAPLKEEKKAPVEDFNPLIEGFKAFKEEEFGLAALFFQQAASAEPGKGRPLFLLAQSFIAQGKFRDAVATIEQGLKRDPEFPISDFRPRDDLYKGIDAEYLRQRKVLDDAAKGDPDNGAFVFLQGYLEWFEGRRPEARKLFARARMLLADPFVVDRFLKAEAVAGLK